MDPETEKAVRENWAAMGMARGHVAEAKQKAQEQAVNPNIKEEGREKGRKRIKALAAIEPHVQDIPITQEGATQARVQRTRQARARAKKIGPLTDPQTGWKMPEVPEGSGWYFSHHADIASAGDQHGFSKEQAITVTTNMSPENHPEIEKRAGRAIMNMVAGQDDHTVHVTPELHSVVNQRLKGSDLQGAPMPANWKGQHVKLSDMDAKHIAAIGSVAAHMREEKQQPVQSTAPFEDLGAARKAKNAFKGIEYLRGQRSLEDVIDPHSAPKLWSYRQNTLDSVPGSAAHLEYMARAQDYQRGGQKGVAQGRRTPQGFHPDTGADKLARMSAQAAKPPAGSPEARLSALQLSAAGIRRHPSGQHTLPDYRPLRQSDEGILAKDRPTAEDTWMQSISTQQDPRSVREGGEPGEAKGRSGSSIAKTLVSDPDLASDKRMRKSSVSSEAKVATDGRVKNAALRHAVENHATRQAAHQIGMPATFTQEVPWSEQRIRADKSPEYRKQLGIEMNLRSLPKQPPPLGRQYPNAPRNPVTPIHHAAAKALYDRVVGGGSVAPHEIEHVEQLRRNAG
jgi:hypothetical protein